MTDEPKLSRRERERLNRRQWVLDAALDVFSEKGYEGASMQEIAQRAEFSVGTLYSLFESKEALYRALLIERALKAGRAFMAALESAEDEEERLRAFIRVKGEVFQDNLKALKLYFSETAGVSLNPTAGLVSDLRQLYERMIPRLAAIFRSGIEKGKFRDFDPTDLAIAFDGLTNIFLFYWAEYPEQFPYEEKAEVIARIFFDAVRAPQGAAETRPRQRG